MANEIVIDGLGGNLLVTKGYGFGVDKLYWIGSGIDSWNNTAKWSYSSGGAPAGIKPDANITACFDANSGNCVVYADQECDNIDLAGYGAYTVSINSGKTLTLSGTVLNTQNKIVGSGTLKFNSAVDLTGINLILDIANILFNENTTIENATLKSITMPGKTLSVTGSVDFTGLGLVGGVLTGPGSAGINELDSVATIGITSLYVDFVNGCAFGTYDGPKDNPITEFTSCSIDAFTPFTPYNNKYVGCVFLSGSNGYFKGEASGNTFNSGSMAEFFVRNDNYDKLFGNTFNDVIPNFHVDEANAPSAVQKFDMTGMFCDLGLTIQGTDANKLYITGDFTYNGLTNNSNVDYCIVDNSIVTIDNQMPIAKAINFYPDGGSNVNWLFQKTWQTSAGLVSEVAELVGTGHSYTNVITTPPTDLKSEVAILDGDGAIQFIGDGRLESEPAILDGDGTLLNYKSCIYSVGTSTDDLKTGSPTVSIVDNMMTFSQEQTSVKMGVGDIVLANGVRYFLKYRHSNVLWEVSDKLGLAVSDITDITVTSIKHSFNSLDAAIGSSGGVMYPTGVVHSDFMGTNDLVTNNIRLWISCYRDDAYDTTPIVVEGLITKTWTHGVHVFAPGINLSEFAPVTADDQYSNVPQHSNGLPNTGYSLVVESGASAIHAKNVHISFTNIDVSGGVDTGIIMEGSLNIFIHNPRVHNCIVHNTGTTGVLFKTSGAGWFSNASSWGNICFNQTDVGVKFQRCVRAFSYANTYYKNNAVTGYACVKTDIDTARIDIGYDVYFGDHSFNDLDINASTNIASLVYSRGETPALLPTSEALRTNNNLVQSYDDIFEDVSVFNLKPKKGSELIMAAVRDIGISGVGEVFPYDLAGTRRFSPDMTIGALESPLQFNFDGSAITKIIQSKLDYLTRAESGHLHGLFRSADKEFFLRPTSGFNTDEERSEFAKEAKIVISLKESYTNYNRKSKTVYSFECYYDYKTNSLILRKPDDFVAGILLKVIGDKQYIFKYYEQENRLDFNIYKAREVSLSGTRSIIANALN